MRERAHERWFRHCSRTVAAQTACIALLAIVATPGQSQTSLPGASDDGETLIVTARKRQEALGDIPIAVTALEGTSLAAAGRQSVREAASLVPGLTITSDGAGRAFIAMRGVGVTLVSTVQPGVGLFIDGIYQPNTSYLNNPLVDVERIEVMRGPQASLYGRNTLGGAINVISRAPGNAFDLRGSAGIAAPDAAWTTSMSVAGALVPDVVQARLGFAHRQQDGFLFNDRLGADANPLRTDALNGQIRILTGGGALLDLKGYADWIDGANTPYARVSGPADYRRTIETNSLNHVRYVYRGMNARLDVPIAALAGTLSLIGAYDARSGDSSDRDTDFGALDAIRSTTTDELRTRTLEARLDTTLGDTLDALIGAFYSHERAAVRTTDRILLANSVRTTRTDVAGDTYALFGTLFWRPGPAWEVTLGLRYDDEARRSSGTIMLVTPRGTASTPFDDRIGARQAAPRLSVSRRWTARFMTYASIARGYRGGGFNPPTAPQRTYRGDSAWTYEGGGRYALPGGAFSLSTSLFYNDYRDYIGLNSIAPAVGSGLVTVDLNTGRVASWGIELEAAATVRQRWTFRAAVTAMRARITDAAPYVATTGRTLASDRLPFQPDWTASLHADYAMPVGRHALVIGAGLTGKGKRLAATLNQSVPTDLDAYMLLDASISWRAAPLSLSAFVTNALDRRYFEAYIEKTTLRLAGLPPSDLGLIGDGRRAGVRISFEF